MVSRAKIPRITYNKEGRIAKIVEKMKSIHKIYFPTPWLLNKHMHTMMGMRFREKSSMKPEREIFVYEDGGNTALDWFLPKEIEEHPVVVVLGHTMGGGTREACVNNLAESFTKKGWIAVVNNMRGGSGAKFTTARFSNGYEQDDFHAVVEHAHKKYSPRHVFLVGFSATAMSAVHYTSLYDDISGSAAISHVYDGYEANMHVLNQGFSKKVYQPFMLSKMKHLLKKNDFIDEETKEKAYKAKTLYDFDDIVVAPQFHCTGREYYKNIDVKGKLEAANIPVLLLGSLDDPFVSHKDEPIEECEHSRNCVLVDTHEGGHVSFLKGMKGKESLIDEIVPEWFECIMNTKLE